MRALYEESDRTRPAIREALGDVQHHVLFIGYPRSGHSLVGSLLDAHPEIVIANELDVLRFMNAGFDREQIAYLLIKNAEFFGDRGRGWGDYDYSVPGQWQGRYRRLRVLGDKKGGATTLKLRRQPAKLDALLSLFDGRLKFIHVVRNPFDVAATLARRAAQPLPDVIDVLFDLCETNAKICGTPGVDAITVYHEAVTANPASAVARLCDFLGVEPATEYLEACAGAVWQNAKQSRHDADWTDAQIAATLTRLGTIEFLHSYTFDGTGAPHG